LKEPEPILVADLFPEILEELLDLLMALSPHQWQAPTACAGWTVHDVALHLLGGDVGILSRERDGHKLAGASVSGWDELVALINHLNDLWLRATRRISPRLLCDLLRHTGQQVAAYFKSLDPYAIGNPVSWAGPAPAPLWMDLAREYTERWHHQQHIRDAVGMPGLTEPRFFSPVLDTFVRALPHTFRDVESREGTMAALFITGEAGARWLLRREGQSWELYVGENEPASAEVALPQEIAWRLFTKGMSREQAAREATVSGDPVLGSKMLDIVSIIA
jgi:uncharacterized protein (TIGR03083 family)